MYNFKLTTKSGSTYFTKAINEDKARTSFLRKRDKSRDSYANICQGKIENLGLTEEAKIEDSKLVKELLQTTDILKVEYIAKCKEFEE